ncbi:hypothetical protein FHY55_19465 [Oceanicola sp. D3]|uniref:phage tail tube protein n=1 Tax=Oceanicola sp. D3 TaxID=2587163 RepID=UPI0011232DBF|nr:phage tail tube protein [Oceanicola sp. D3]QDC11278.1 hypothetical protein FHY55_19465 [Oceanicola sp. D3]
MARAQGARALLAAAFESTYGTSPASGFFKLPYLAGNDIDASQELLDADLLGFGRDPLEPDLDVLNAEGSLVVPMDTESFGVWLKATFGAPTTTGAGPYTHTFATGNWSLPSLSLERQFPEVPSFEMIKGVMVNTMSWDMGRAGRAQANLGLYAQGVDDPDTSSNAGTLDEYDRYRFMQPHGAITRGGSDLASVESVTVNYTNNLDRVEVIRNDGLIDGLDPSQAMLSGQLVARFDSLTLFNQAIAGSSAAFTFAYERGTGQSLTLSVPRVFLSRPKKPIEGPQGVRATFDWKAALQADGNPMATIALINAVESY